MEKRRTSASTVMLCNKEVPGKFHTVPGTKCPNTDTNQSFPKRVPCIHVGVSDRRQFMKVKVISAVQVPAEIKATEERNTQRKDSVWFGGRGGWIILLHLESYYLTLLDFFLMF